MAETTWTEEDIASISSAIKSGVLSVTYSGPPQRSITYQNLDAMRRLRAEMIREVRGATAYRRVAFSKGFRNGCGGGFRRNG